MSSWETLETFGDQIIEVAAARSSRLYARSNVTASASAHDLDPEDSSLGAPGQAVDNDYDTFWQSSIPSLPQTLTLALASSQSVSGVRVAQKEWNQAIATPPYGKLPEWIKSFEVAVSSDGVNFTTVWSGELKKQRGAQVVSFSPVNATHIRLKALSNWQGTNMVRIASVDILKQ